MSAAHPPNDFGTFLRDALRAKGISRKELAARVAVSQNTVSSWTKGRFLPDHTHSEQIAAALEISIDQLHGRTPPEPLAKEPRGAHQMPARPMDQEARRIIEQLATLQVDEPLQGLHRATPELLRVLEEARAAAGRRDEGGPDTLDA
jgi:transcriptional regulator with XRE-family HTH domain